MVSLFYKGKPAVKPRSFWPLASPAYAAEIQPHANAIVLPQDLYQSLVAKGELLKELQGKDLDKITDDELKALLEKPVDLTSYTQASGYQDGNTYVVFTGKDGRVSITPDRGKYRIQIDPIDGIDIKAPETIEIPFGNVPVVNIGFQAGLGRVSLVKNYTYNAGISNKATFQLYFDRNGNGKKEVREKLLPWAGVKITLTKRSSDHLYHLNSGWNTVVFPRGPSQIRSAGSLIGEVTKQGGYPTAVARWQNGAWEEYVVRGDAHYGLNFPIIAGGSYLVMNHFPSDLLVYSDGK